MKLYLALLLVCGLLFSCSHNHNPEAGHNEVHAAVPALSLNGEQRWQADDATNANMQQLQQLMHDHLRQPDADNPESVSDLRQKAKLGFDKVFSDCRMKGPEHDMLHVYLMPMLDDIKVMDTNDLQTAIAARDRLASRLDQYQTYFK
ncbi:hypothetical protein [Pontibacter populi]|uniref:Uncharacterized protein n=1 Tax=Pontibacter populi TaxID=890055 RepID=A0ABV1RQU9_9BACT